MGGDQDHADHDREHPGQVDAARDRVDRAKQHEQDATHQRDRGERRAGAHDATASPTGQDRLRPADRFGQLVEILGQQSLVRLIADQVGGIGYLMHLGSRYSSTRVGRSA